MTDKTALLASIRTFRQEVLSILDRFEEELVSLGDPQPEQTTTAQTDNDNWMTAKQVCDELNISDSTFYAWINAGLLPGGVAFGPRSKRWKMSDIRAWQKSKNQDAEEQPKTITRRRGRVSRVKKIKEFAYV